MIEGGSLFPDRSFVLWPQFSFGVAGMDSFPTFKKWQNSVETLLLNVFWRPLSESHWAWIALCSQLAMHVIWAVSFRLSETYHVLIDLFLAYKVQFSLTPAVIAFSVIALRIPVHSPVNDTWRVTLGLLSGEALGWAVGYPLGSNTGFTMHCALAAVHLAVIVPIVMMLFSLACLARRHGGRRSLEEKGDATH